MQKKLVDKLIEECTENIKEVKVVSENKNKCSSYVLYIVLFSIILQLMLEFMLLNAIDFVYYKYANNNKKNVSKYDYVYQTKN